jgi:hypothetical protein
MLDLQRPAVLNVHPLGGPGPPVPRVNADDIEELGAVGDVSARLKARVIGIRVGKIHGSPADPASRGWTRPTVA